MSELGYAPFDLAPRGREMGPQQKPHRGSMGGREGEQASTLGRGKGELSLLPGEAAAGALPERPGLAREAEICR